MVDFGASCLWIIVRYPVQGKSSFRAILSYLRVLTNVITSSPKQLLNNFLRLARLLLAIYRIPLHMIYHQAGDSRIVNFLFLNETDMKGDNYEYKYHLSILWNDRKTCYLLQKLTFIYFRKGCNSCYFFATDHV